MEAKSNPVIEALKSYQQGKNLTDGDLAAVLSIDRSTLSYIKVYKRQAGARVLRTIAQNIPELRQVVIDFVVFGDGQGTPQPEA